ncbi:phosphonate C-P lyase system protein PhnL [Magnetovibrio sp.]|uniref:phosphonate C-P lyase system protein PhnL n=1 Tax=Magnetovibrio sp. TaxID=2024836 RepID=UPI002F92FD59
MNSDTPMIMAEQLGKTFVLHNQGGQKIPVFHGLDLTVYKGECVVLHGPSGAGKSTLMRALYGNYLVDQGSIRVNHNGTWVDMSRAEPQKILAVRKSTMGYVSQFLRAIPRVSALDIVAEPLLVLGEDESQARTRAGELLSRLRVPESLWGLAPATFSGGEQQRVNIARGFSADFPVLLLDEPTASLDAKNRQTVTDMIGEAVQRGTAIVGIFHDEDVRNAVGTRLFDIKPAKEAA